MTYHIHYIQEPNYTKPEKETNESRNDFAFGKSRYCPTEPTGKRNDSQY